MHKKPMFLLLSTQANYFSKPSCNDYRKYGQNSTQASHTQNLVLRQASFKKKKKLIALQKSLLYLFYSLIFHNESSQKLSIKFNSTHSNSPHRDDAHCLQFNTHRSDLTANAELHMASLCNRKQQEEHVCRR